MSEARAAEFAEVLIEVRIDATPEKVWQELTGGIGAWWPSEFYAGGVEGKRSYHLEVTPGGRMYEAWEGGGGVLWGRVATVDPGKTLQIIGHTFPEWGGPSTWFGSWQLSSDAESCVLRFTESTLGRVSNRNLEEKEKGWQFLFGSALKAHVEGKPCPPWPG